MKRDVLKNWKGFSAVIAATIAAHAAADGSVLRDFDPFHISPAILNAALNGSSSSSSGGEYHSVPTRSILDPEWKEDRIARVNYSFRKDQRKGDDFWIYRINEDGRIDGSELLARARPVERSIFEERMRQHCVAGNPGELYRQYLGQVQDQQMGLLVMSRILDHEAMKRKMSPEVSDNRVDYVFRSVVIKFALQANKVGAGQDLSVTSNQQLYGYLKQAAGTQPVALNIDWNYRERGLYDLFDSLNDRGEFAWEPVRLEWQRLPDDWQAFREDIKRQLQPKHRELMRQMIWRVLVLERNPDLQWQQLFSTSTDELRRQYDAMRESRFVEAQPVTAQVLDLVVSGQKASEFTNRFRAELTKREEALTKELFEGATQCSDQSQESRDRLKARIAEVRRQVPQEVYAQIAGEFAADLAGGNVSARLAPRTMSHDGIAQLPTDQSVDAQQKRAVFGPIFASLALFPVLETPDTDHSIKVLLLTDVQQGQKRYVSIDDDAVHAFLRQKIMAKTQGRFFRETAFQLLRENRAEITHQTCRDEYWPCLNDNPRLWAEAMFPEVLYPNASLGFDGPGRPVTSTLGRPELMNRVFDFNMNVFGQLFTVPNEHIDPELRLRLHSR